MGCVPSHKWLCALKGAGFLYVRRERQSLLNPLVVSWGWQARTPGPLALPGLFWLDRHGRPVGIPVRSGGDGLSGGARVGPGAGGLPAPADPAESGEALRARLWEEHRAEVPIMDWQGWRLVRVSIQTYNITRDVERLAVLGKPLPGRCVSATAHVR